MFPGSVSVFEASLPLSGSERGQRVFAGMWVRLVGKDALHLLLDLPGQEQAAVVEDVHLEVTAPVEDGDVLALCLVLDGV